MEENLQVVTVIGVDYIRLTTRRIKLILKHLKWRKHAWWMVNVHSREERMHLRYLSGKINMYLQPFRPDVYYT